MSRFGLLLLSLLLVLSAEAGAKGPTSVEVCGADGCREIESLETSSELTAPLFRAQGRPDSPPATSSGWYDVTMMFGDFPERFALLQDPAYIRAVGRREGIVAPREKDGRYGWLRLTPAEAEAHERLTNGIDPLPISELPHLRGTAPDLAAAVRAAELAEGDGTSTRWLAIAAVVTLLACVAFVLIRRRSRPTLKSAL